MKKLFVVLAAVVSVVVSAASVPVVAPILLVDEEYVEAKNIEDKAVYQLSTTVGHDIEIKLGENPSAKELWQVVSYDFNRCRIKIDHNTKGIWPFKKEYAEIELKGLTRGQQDIVLQCGTKRITLRFHSF